MQNEFYSPVKPETSPIENIDPAEMPETPAKNRADQYYANFPEGLCRDAEKALNQTARYEYITSPEAPEELRELFNQVADTIEDEKDIRLLTEIILRAIRDETQESAIKEADQIALDKIKRKLNGIEEPAFEEKQGMVYNFDSIRARLEAAGVTLKSKKTTSEYN